MAQDMRGGIDGHDLAQNPWTQSYLLVCLCVSMFACLVVCPGGEIGPCSREQTASGNLFKIV